MHFALGALNAASLRAVVSRPLALPRRGGRSRLGSGTRGVQIVRAEIKRIPSPAGNTVDTCEVGASATCKNVSFRDPPVFDRSTSKTGIVHIGVGGFHRSHQQAYLNDLLRTQPDRAKDWCYTGMGVMPADANMRDYLKDNDWTYPIVARTGASVDDMEVEVEEVYSIRDMLLAFEDTVACVDAMASPDVKIVSLTVTEFGYRVPLTAGDFKLVELALEGKLHAGELPEECKNPTTFGLICAACAARFQRGARPFTLMSCDNLPHNGAVCKERMTSAAEELVCSGLCAANLEQFIVSLQTEVKYPSTMVDRITPATSWEDIATLPQRVGFEDAWPVMCEPYKHWVIEDDFVDGSRPNWEDVGAVLVPDVIPHELMKVRLLNVTHSAMCYAGILAGCEHVHEGVSHQIIRPYLKRLMTKEIAASLVADPSMEALVDGLDAYADLVLKRFENVAVKDTLERIAMDGSEKFRVQGRAVVTEGLADERSVRGFALYVATWAHYLKNSVAAGDKVRDASAGLISAPWAANGGGLEAFLDIEEVFGVLAQHEGWRSAVTREFGDIEESGLEATLLGYIFGTGHNSNGDLSSMELGGRRSMSERVSGTFVLDETCAPIMEEPTIAEEQVALVPL